MKVLLDAQLPPSLGIWIADQYAVEAVAVRDIGLRDARDQEIFDRAKQLGAVVMTKDSDFVELVHRLGVPPQVVWVTCGNVTTMRLKQILSATFADALQLLRDGEEVVEIGDK
jgi:predicted nuclease of predicted toxin-antitoxin system